MKKIGEFLTISSFLLISSGNAYAMRSGTPTPIADHPEVGFLNPACTATFINENTYITAVHCLFPNNLAVSTVTVQISGQTVTLHPKPGGVKILSVGKSKELALVRVQETINLPLFPPLATEDPAVGQTVKGIGFGATGFLPRTDKRLSALFQVAGTGSVDLQDGTGSGDMIQIVPQFGGNSVPCSGDSGGPLFSAAGELVGVLSFGVGSPDETQYQILPELTERCLKTEAAYYVSVSSNAAWIQQTLSDLDQQ